MGRSDLFAIHGFNPGDVGFLLDALLDKGFKLLLDPVRQLDIIYRDAAVVLLVLGLLLGLLLRVQLRVLGLVLLVLGPRALHFRVDARS